MLKIWLLRLLVFIATLVIGSVFYVLLNIITPYIFLANVYRLPIFECATGVSGAFFCTFSEPINLILKIIIFVLSIYLPFKLIKKEKHEEKAKGI